METDTMLHHITKIYVKLMEDGRNGTRLVYIHTYVTIVRLKFSETTWNYRISLLHFTK